MLPCVLFLFFLLFSSLLYSLLPYYDVSLEICLMLKNLFESIYNWIWYSSPFCFSYLCHIHQIHFLILLPFQDIYYNCYDNPFIADLGRFGKKKIKFIQQYLNICVGSAKRMYIYGQIVKHIQAVSVCMYYDVTLWSTPSTLFTGRSTFKPSLMS